MVEPSADRRSPARKQGILAAALARFFGPPIEQLTAQAAQARSRAAVILDVRELSEYRSGHIPGSLHIPLRELRSRMTELSREREVIVVCRSGNRSQAAARVLAGAGYEVRNLRGGMLAWAGEKLPVRTGKPRR